MTLLTSPLAMKLAKGKTHLWVAERRGPAVFIRTGKAGTAGRLITRELATEEEAQTFLRAERDKHLAEGYELVDERTGVSDRFTVDGQPKAERKLPARYAYLEDRIRTLVRGGFVARHRMSDQIDELLVAEPNAPSWLRAILDKLLDREHDALRGQPRPDPCINDRIDAAFEELDHGGIVALQNAGTTQSDGWSDANHIATMRSEAGNRPRGACFYHGQDLERGVRGDGLLLTFGAYASEASQRDAESEAVARTIVEVLRRHGVEVEWSGRVGDRIAIRPFVWFRRA